VADLVNVPRAEPATSIVPVAITADDRAVQRLEQQLHALGSFARDGPIFRRVHDLGVRGFIVARARRPARSRSVASRRRTACS
jgi:hypothetical protein